MTTNQRGRTIWMLVVLVCAVAPALLNADERFVPAEQLLRPAVIELKSEATIVGTEIRFRQIARWPEADDAAMDQTGDLIIARFDAAESAMSLDLEKIKQTLEGAGVNVAAINFHGATACRVSRSDARLEDALEQATSANSVKSVAVRPRATISTVTPPVETTGRAETSTEPSPCRSLSEILVADLAARLAMPTESLQVKFRPQDEKLVSLREPFFRFQVAQRRQRNLATAAWDVTIATDSGKQKATIGADVRVWQKQLLAARPIAYKQTIRDEDIVERQVLTEQFEESVPLTKAQVVGQEAAREIAANTPLTARMIEAAQMVRTGELVNVLVALGHVQVNWVAQAREGGVLGQTILVRKPLSPREEFKVTITGRQQAKLLGPALTEDGSRIAAAQRH